MKIRLFVVLSIFSMFVFSCKTTETNTDMITGMIYDNEGECVSGVKIFVEGKLIAQSDLYGHFYVPVNELSENHQVELSKEEYEAITMKIDPFSSVKMLYVVMRNYRQILNEIEQSISDGEFGKGLELCHKAKNIKNSVYIDYLESTILICSRNYYPAIDILEKISNGEKANKYCILLLADAYERTSQKEKAVVMLKAKSKEFFDDDISDRLAELCNMN